MKAGWMNRRMTFGEHDEVNICQQNLRSFIGAGKNKKNLFGLSSNQKEHLQSFFLPKNIT